MTFSASGLGQVRFLDLQIFSEVCRTKTIRGVARRLAMTPGQISKSIQGLESKFGQPLFKRSPSGVLLTNAGADLLKIAAEILEGAEKMDRVLVDGTSSKRASVLALASPLFLTNQLVVPAVSAMSSDSSGTTDDYGFRFLDLGPDQLVPAALRGAFEIAVHFGTIAWPSTWLSTLIGHSRWVIALRDRHPLQSGASLDDVLAYQFVMPSYWTSEGLVRGNDQFPVPAAQRRLGFETSTADAAIPILLQTDQIAFLPEILVRPWLKSKQLRTISLQGLGDWTDVEKEVYVTVRTDAITHRLHQSLVTQLKKSLSDEA